MKRKLWLVPIIWLASWVAIILLILGICKLFELDVKILASEAKSTNPTASQVQEPTTLLGGETASTSSVKQYVIDEAKRLGINPMNANWIISHESHYGLSMVGDDGICRDKKSPNYGKDTKSRGYWQINSCYHPEVSDKCAYDLKCSTDWSLKQMLKGNINQWSSWRLRHKLYADAPD